MFSDKTPPVVVAIPVRNEVERIDACLRALACQSEVAPPSIIVLLNNCDDGTDAVIEALRPRLPNVLHALSVDLAPNLAQAGFARAMAMESAALLAGPHGVLLTTDADGAVPPDWTHANLRAIGAGADAVCGRAEIDPAEASLIPKKLHDDHALETAYGAALDEIIHLLDPDDADPWPRHRDASGASIAVTVSAFRAVGGMPGLPTGEDRAFIERLQRRDARIRHAPEVWVRVSGRIEGRAADGMADTIRRRLAKPDLFLDDGLEPVADAARRASLRRVLRTAHRTGRNPSGAVAGSLAMDADRLAGALAQTYFGQAWADIEAASPVLARRRVRAADVVRETALARSLLSGIIRGRPGVTAKSGAAKSGAAKSGAAKSGATAEQVDAVARVADGAISQPA